LGDCESHTERNGELCGQKKTWWSGELLRKNTAGSGEGVNVERENKNLPLNTKKGDRNAIIIGGLQETNKRKEKNWK